MQTTATEAQVRRAMCSAANEPHDYDSLTPAQKDVLQSWIALAVQPADHYTGPISFPMKHDAAAETFYITHGQLKGAMLAAGYEPRDATEFMWRFKCKPTNPAHIARRRLDTAGYSTAHCDADARAALQAKIATLHGAPPAQQIQAA